MRLLLTSGLTRLNPYSNGMRIEQRYHGIRVYRQGSVLILFLMESG